MQIKFLFGCIQETHRGSHILPAVLHFFKIDPSGRSVIAELARDAELLARSL